MSFLWHDFDQFMHKCRNNVTNLSHVDITVIVMCFIKDYKRDRNSLKDIIGMKISKLLLVRTYMCGCK